MGPLYSRSRSKRHAGGYRAAPDQAARPAVRHRRSRCAGHQAELRRSDRSSRPPAPTVRRGRRKPAEASGSGPASRRQRAAEAPDIRPRPAPGALPAPRRGRSWPRRAPAPPAGIGGDRTGAGHWRGRPHPVPTPSRGRGRPFRRAAGRRHGPPRARPLRRRPRPDACAGRAWRREVHAWGSSPLGPRQIPPSSSGLTRGSSPTAH
uniref:Basic proline-rich protein n=1 Tax=Parastrongyloides trichosuri TaxID=131310 RepID=A0A0N4ZJH2_PARTI